MAPCSKDAELPKGPSTSRQVGHLVGRVHEHQLVRPGQIADCLGCFFAVHRCSLRKSKVLQVLLDTLALTPVALHEVGLTDASAEGLDAEGTRASKQVQHPYYSPLQRTENVEDGSPYQLRCGSGTWYGRPLQRASSGRSAKHTHDRWDFLELW